MRTDAKVGLVCVLILAIALVSYFVLHNPQPKSTHADVADAAVPLTPVTAPPPSAAGPVFSPPLSESTSLAAGPTYTPPSGTAIVPDATPTTAPSPDRRLLPPPTGPVTTMPSYTTGGGYSPATTGPSSHGPGTSYGTEVSPLDRPGTGTGYSTGTGYGTGSSSYGTGTGTSTYSSGSLLEPRRATIGETPGTYTVQAGDTLGAIAKKHNVTLKALQAANPGVDSTRLKIKQVIKIPEPSSSTGTSSGTSSGTSTTSGTLTGSSSGGSSTVRPTRPAVRPAITAGSSYTVKKGDTLRKIAKAAYGNEDQWKRIFRANRGELSSANDIEVGMVLKLPAK